ncbi:MAG: ATP-binding protein [Muribaculaceae bacterium]
MSEDEKELSTEDLLSKLGLISSTGKLKNAAVVLFGRDINKFYSSIEFKIGRFHNSESNLITQDVVEGNVIEMAGKVMEVLRSKYLISLIEYKGEQRIERLEIPEPALREIIYNSIAHRDYQGASIQCRVYDDIIEIWNPGLLPEGLTPDTIFERHASYPRNKCIAYAFFKAGFIESWGRGYKKIEEELTKVNIEIPKVTEVCGGVLITIKRKLTVDSAKPKNVGNNVGDFDKDILWQLSERQRHICDIIRKSPEVTAKRMSVTLSVAKRTIERDLAYLTSKGILRREGKPNSGIWVLLV